MTDDFRRDPRVEGRITLVEFGRTLLWGSLAVVVLVVVPAFWPEEWTEPDESTRDRIVLIAGAVLTVFAALTLGKCLLHLHRWRRARRWERMLDDPETAHLVPPRAEHTKSVRTASGLALIGGSIVAVLVGAGLVVYGVLAWSGRASAVHDTSGEDQSGTFILWGALLFVFGLFLVRQSRRWMVARRVERLSSDPALAAHPVFAADVAAQRAPAIPDLEVCFDGEPVQFRRATPTRRDGASSNEPLRILYLRLFDNVAGTTRFLQGPWRRRGYIHLLRSADQVEADELEAAEESGSVRSLFISSSDQLDAVLASQPIGRHEEPMPDGFVKRWRWITNAERGRYPVRALLCHGSFWKAAVDLLLARMDVVVLDLSGYRPQQAGTRYELQRIVDRYPIEHVMLLAEPASDERFLTAQVEAAWAQMAHGSPNAGTGSRTVHVALNA